MSGLGQLPIQERFVRIGVGEAFPALTAHHVSGGEITLPDDVAGGWAVLLFYRGHWCPYCRQQLSDFEEHLDRFRATHVEVVALSTDPEAEARATVEKHAIQFPVGYGLDPILIRETLGTYLGEDEAYVQATGFVLRPNGRVELAVYSSGAVGRLVAADVLGLIEYARTRE